MSSDEKSWSDTGDAASRTRRRKLGDVLVEAGILTEAELAHALDDQARKADAGERIRLGQIVQDLGYASDRELAQALAASLNLPLAQLKTAPDPEMARLLPRQVADRHGVLVIGKQGTTVTVAVTDPTNVVGLDDVRAWTGAVKLVVQVAPESILRDLLDRVWRQATGAGVAEELSELTAEGNAGDESLTQTDVDDAPVVRLVDVIIGDAVRAGASDIHIEPQRDQLRIRYRVDGLLRDVMTTPKSVSAAVVSRVKIVSNLDIAERRRPQDGRVRLTIEGEIVEARASTLPSLHGEKVVMRLLPRAESVPLLSKTGLSPDQIEMVASSLVASRGLVLITGPTGSGKTNTLYAALQQVSTPDRNIVTLEDPVEIQVPGITQVQISERTGLTFARGLRSVLRQDPDVILVGETRDAETAELALQASLTGHLVLTTLHTNDAISAITRLVDMGVDAFLVASSLTLVVAQRLVRRPCSECAQPYTPSPRTLELLGISEAELAKGQPMRGRGCENCGGTGYNGRTGVFEVLPISGELRRVLLSTPTEAAIAAAARAHGMVTLRAAALVAAARGETTYEEVLRVTHVEGAAVHRCPSCARTLADDMLCCPYDGTVLETNQCRSCTRGIEPDWFACPYCHARTGVEASLAQAPEELPHILVVEDERHVAEFVRTALLGSARTTLAGDATEALQLLASVSFDGAIIDYGLPDLSGLELVRLVRTDPKTLTLPIMLFTGRLTNELEAQARLAGVDDVLAKPVEPILLEERMQGLIERSARVLHSASVVEDVDEHAS